MKQIKLVDLGKRNLAKFAAAAAAQPYYQSIIFGVAVMGSTAAEGAATAQPVC